MRRLPCLVAALVAFAPAPALADRKAVEAVVDAGGIKAGGEIIVSRFDKMSYRARWGSAIVAAQGKWRWASVTKQVIATLVMQEVAARRVALDEPVATYLPRFASPNAARVTVRQLLRHQSGLPNPDDTAAAADAIPAYDAPGYPGGRDPLTGYCAGPVKRAPGRERRGQIGGVQVRNFILPEWDAVVIVFADRASQEFGEVRQGKGFSYDLLSAGVCG